MKTLEYSVICEDIAHLSFIKCLLQNSSFGYKFNFHQEFYNRFKANTSANVLNIMSNASIRAFRDYRINILFIGVDFDSRDRNRFNEELKDLYDKLDIKINKVVIFFPVQAIEHWLLYIKYHKENPASTKNIHYENKPRKEAKIEIYGKVKTTSKNVEEIVTGLTSEINIEWLVQKSESFKVFIGKLNEVLSGLKE